MTINGTELSLVGDVVWATRVVEGKLVSIVIVIELDAVLGFVP